jgi:hypothetical protein
MPGSRGKENIMPKVKSGAVMSSRFSPVSDTSNRDSQQADVAECICAVAYRDGKTATGGYAAALGVLSACLKIDQKATEQAVVAGVGLGWFRRRGKQIELTSAGIYMAKLVLKLPT